MLYKLLRQRNDEYDADLYQELDDFYVGGRQLLKRAKSYMPQLVGEHIKRYEERLKAASYINHLQQIVDFYVSNLFGQEIVVTPPADANDTSTLGSAPTDDFYSLFAKDSDRQGTSFAMLLRAVMPMALLKRRALIAVDFPERTAEMAVESRADEDKLGLTRAYCLDVPVEQLIDWEYDDSGHFAWAVLHRTMCRRESPGMGRDDVVEEFKVWQRDAESKKIRWELYRVKYSKEKPPSDDEDIKPELKGDSTFQWVPIIELKMPMGLWVGNKIGNLAREHFQRRNALISSENKSLFALPVAALGPEIGGIGEAMPSEIQQNSARLQGNGAEGLHGQFTANGFIVTGSQDKIYYAEPNGLAYTIIDGQLDKLVDEMFRVTDQMANSITNTSSALGRSGTSKREDKSAMEVVLGALGALVRDFSTRIYDTMSTARKENVIWTARGLDKYELVDRETLLEEAAQLDAVPVNSKTFRKTWKTKVALALLGGVPPATQDLVRQEIEASIEQEGDLAEIQAAAEEDDGDEPPPPPAKGGKGKGGGAPRGAAQARGGKVPAKAKPTPAGADGG